MDGHSLQVSSNADTVFHGEMENKHSNPSQLKFIQNVYKISLVCFTMSKFLIKKYYVVSNNSDL